MSGNDIVMLNLFQQLLQFDLHIQADECTTRRYWNILSPQTRAAVYKYGLNSQTVKRYIMDELAHAISPQQQAMRNTYEPCDAYTAFVQPF